MNCATGSALQIVTEVQIYKDANELYIIKEGDIFPVKISGDPFLYGEAICLEHIATQKNYNSHYFKSIVINSQEGTNSKNF